MRISCCPRIRLVVVAAPERIKGCLGTPAMTRAFRAFLTNLVFSYHGTKIPTNVRPSNKGPVNTQHVDCGNLLVPGGTRWPRSPAPGRCVGRVPSCSESRTVANLSHSSSPAAVSSAS